MNEIYLSVVMLYFGASYNVTSLLQFVLTAPSPNRSSLDMELECVSNFLNEVDLYLVREVWS